MRDQDPALAQNSDQRGVRGPVDAADAALVAILREGRVLVPQPQDPLQPGDELFFVTSQDVEQELEDLFSAG